MEFAQLKRIINNIDKHENMKHEKCSKNYALATLWYYKFKSYVMSNGIGVPSPGAIDNSSIFDTNSVFKKDGSYVYVLEQDYEVLKNTFQLQNPQHEHFIMIKTVTKTIQIPDQKYICNQCLAEFNTKRCLTDHMIRRHPEKMPFKCENCIFKSLNKNALLFHQKKCNQKKLETTDKRSVRLNKTYKNSLNHSFEKNIHPYMAVENKKQKVVNLLKNHIERNIEPPNKRSKLDCVEELFEENENLEFEKILKEKEEFQNKFLENEKLNFELIDILRLEKIGKEKLKQKVVQIEKEKEELQNKCIEFERLNSKLEEKLRFEENEKEKLKQSNQDYAMLYIELQKELRKAEKSETEKLKQENQDYVKLNFVLQRDLSAEKSETEKLKQRNEELERRIAMLHNADDVSEFEEGYNVTVKQEFIKLETEK